MLLSASILVKMVQASLVVGMVKQGMGVCLLPATGAGTGASGVLGVGATGPFLSPVAGTTGASSVFLAGGVTVAASSTLAGGATGASSALGATGAMGASSALG